jgi:hypothetical protein
MVAFLSKDLSFFAKVLSFCMKMPGVIHPTQHLFMAVNLIGSVPILHSVFYLSLNPWEAPGWQVNAIDADVKQVVTSWLQTLNNRGFTLKYKPRYPCGGKCEYGSGALRSDVYHLLDVCHVLIKVTITFWYESVCYLIVWQFFIYIYIYILYYERGSS